MGGSDGGRGLNLSVSVVRWLKGFESFFGWFLMEVAVRVC